MRACVCACMHLRMSTHTHTHTHIYICSLKWNGSILLLQNFEWSEFSVINVDIQLVYLIVIKCLNNF